MALEVGFAATLLGSEVASSPVLCSMEIISLLVSLTRVRKVECGWPLVHASVCEGQVLSPNRRGLCCIRPAHPELRGSRGDVGDHCLLLLAEVLRGFR